MTRVSPLPPAASAPGVFASTALLFACAGLPADPGGIGQGQYLQVFSGSTVVAEIDTSNAGMLPCSQQAYQLLQQNPSLKDRVRCAFARSTDPLPFGFRAHRRLAESDGFKPSAPYLTRVSTAQLCRTMRDATAAVERTVILEDGCSPPLGAVPASNNQGASAPTSSSATSMREEQRAIAFKWEGEERVMAGYVTLNQSGRSGQVRGRLPGDEGECTGMFEAGADGKGQWALSCTNGLTALGTFTALGQGKGSVGTGRDSRGRKVEFTLAGRP